MYSVLLVSIGVALTTFSAKQPSASKASASSDLQTYLAGIGILVLALILSGLLGLLQEWTYRTYGGPSSTSGTGTQPTWRESMFYLHFLGLPMFAPLVPKLRDELHLINHTSPRMEISAPLPEIVSSSPVLTSIFPSLAGSTPPIPPPFSIPSLEFIIPPTFRNNTFITFDTTAKGWNAELSQPQEIVNLNLSLPKAYLPLLLNTLTQLLCVSGVHRLTTRVTNLTVTLILVVRKAVSLVISLKGRVLADELSKLLGVNALLSQSEVGQWAWDRAGELVKVALGVDEAAAAKRTPPQVDEGMMWTGAGLVLLGTVGYTIGTSAAKAKKADKPKKE